jgi:hypothetical protein
VNARFQAFSEFTAFNLCLRSYKTFFKAIMDLPLSTFTLHLWKSRSTPTRIQFIQPGFKQIQMLRHKFFSHKTLTKLDSNWLETIDLVQPAFSSFNAGSQAIWMRGKVQIHSHGCEYEIWMWMVAVLGERRVWCCDGLAVVCALVEQRQGSGGRVGASWGVEMIKLKVFGRIFFETNQAVWELTSNRDGIMMGYFDVHPPPAQQTKKRYRRRYGVWWKKGG